MRSGLDRGWTLPQVATATRNPLLKLPAGSEEPLPAPPSDVTQPSSPELKAQDPFAAFDIAAASLLATGSTSPVGMAEALGSTARLAPPGPGAKDPAIAALEETLRSRDGGRVNTVALAEQLITTLFPVEPHSEPLTFQPNVMLRLPISVLADVEAFGIQNQFETYGSCGSFAPELRLATERQMLGLQFLPLYPKSLHPKSAFVAVGDNVAYTHGTSKLEQYGEVILVLDPRVHRRCTVTDGDSLLYTGWRTTRALAALSPQEAGAGDHEVLIWGQLGLQDVSEILVPTDLPIAELHRMRGLAQRHGLTLGGYDRATQRRVSDWCPPAPDSASSQVEREDLAAPDRQDSLHELRERLAAASSIEQVLILSERIAQKDASCSAELLDHATEVIKSRLRAIDAAVHAMVASGRSDDDLDPYTRRDGYKHRWLLEQSLHARRDEGCDLFLLSLDPKLPEALRLALRGLVEPRLWPARRAFRDEVVRHLDRIRAAYEFNGEQNQQNALIQRLQQEVALVA